MQLPCLHLANTIDSFYSPLYTKPWKIKVHQMEQLKIIISGGEGKLNSHLLQSSQLYKPLTMSTLNLFSY